MEDVTSAPPRRQRIWQAASALWGSRPGLLVKKSPDLVYAVNDRPPTFVLLLSSLQHIGLLAVSLNVALVVVNESSAEPATAVNLLSLVIFASGVATLLHCLSGGPIGSGYLCPTACNAIFLAPSLLALKAGGLDLIAGMTMVGGCIEALLSRVLKKLRRLLPPEVGGLVVFFVGTTLAAVSFRSLLGVGAPAPPTAVHWITALGTLGTTIVLNVWGRGSLRMFCALIGMAAGYAIAIATGLLTETDYATLSALPLLALPSFQHGFAFSTSLLLPFAIAGIASALKVIGVITVSQRVNNVEWVRPEMSSISRAILADGLGNVCAGLAGAPIGLNSAAGSPGLAAATGVASRVVGLVAGVILIAVACLPPVAGTLVLMPRAVLGAGLLFTACFILVNGLQTITARMLDVRRTVMIGLAVSCGIAAETLPGFAASFPADMQPLMGSSLVVGTAIALAFNTFFLIGLRKRAVLTVAAEDSHSAKRVDDFFTETGQRWAARKDVISRVTFGVNQAVEAIRDHCEPQGHITVTAGFDEFSVDVEILYRGIALELPDRRPSEREIMETDAGLRRLAGYMLRRNADRVRADLKNESNRIQFHFDH